MLNAKQISVMISDALVRAKADKVEPREAIDTVAEKIAALVGDDGATLAAAMLENEVTSTLMDMTVATVLATLIEEEGGGRSNVSISPMSMDHMQQHYLYEVRNEGMIRHVSIKLREDSNLQDEAAWREPSNRHGVMHQDEDTSNAKPQAEPKVHDRPYWVVKEGGQLSRGISLEQWEKATKADCEELVRNLPKDPSVPITIENRYCLHSDCPSMGCNRTDV